ncbi:MAG: hypothetical protein AAGD14_09460 [Planctomycetota bacterium]
MRFRFLQTGEAWDAAERNAALDRIDAWWKAFGATRETILRSFRGEAEWDLGDWMLDHLGAVDDELMWEFGPGIHKEHRLVITPESARHLHPLVEVMLQRCPGYDDWEFYAARPRESAGHARAMIEARNLMALEGARVLATPTEECFVDLTFFSESFAGPEDNDAKGSAWVATGCIVGEETLDVWIGEIHVRHGDGRSEGAVPLDAMQEAVDAAIERVRAQLPAEPLWKTLGPGTGTVWQLKPNERDTYPRRTDLLTCRSCHNPLWTATNSGWVVDSRRYSRFEEIFAYVKMEGLGVLSGDHFEEKAAIEDALIAALTERELGAVIGGGTGLRYAYIDLALAKADEAIETAIHVLRERNIARNSWILFFDKRFEQEWVGIWEESPPPP